MKIELKKFGTTLLSRDGGRESYKAIQPILKELENNEELILDFDGVNTFSPSWGDEFITNLSKTFTEKLVLTNTSNQSVQATLELLSKINNVEFNIK